MRAATWDYYEAFGLPRPSRKLFRLLRGPYSIAELARSMDVDGSAIMDWENGRTKPSAPHLRQLVDHYGMTVRKYGRDPLGLYSRGRPGVPSPAARQAARQAKEPPVTPPAPSSTAGKQEGAPAPPPSPPSDPSNS